MDIDNLEQHRRVVDTKTACEILGGISRTTFCKLKKDRKIIPVPYHRGRFDIQVIEKYLNEISDNNNIKNSIDEIISGRLEKYGKI